MNANEFKLGDFPFINLSRMASSPTRRLLIETRPGADGVTAWKDGKRGQPFQVASVVEAADVDAARDLFREYEQAVGEDPLTIRWAGDQLDNLRVLVLDVQPVEHGVHATVLGVGGVDGGATYGLVRAVWTLLPVDPGQDDEPSQA